MKIQELKDKSLEEITNVLTVKREKLRELRFKDSNKQLKNIREIRAIKKDIAKILTWKNNKNNE
jgi:ribosomal protein L29